MVPSTPDPHRAAFDPGAPQRAEPGRPARDRRREALQGEREGRAARQSRVDGEVRHRLTHSPFVLFTEGMWFVHHILLYSSLSLAAYSGLGTRSELSCSRR